MKTVKSSVPRNLCQRGEDLIQPDPGSSRKPARSPFRDDLVIQNSPRVQPVALP